MFESGIYLQSGWHVFTVSRTSKEKGSMGEERRGSSSSQQVSFDKFEWNLSSQSVATVLNLFNIFF